MRPLFCAARRPSLLQIWSRVLKCPAIETRRPSLLHLTTVVWINSRAVGIQAKNPLPEERPLPLWSRPDDGEHPLDEWLTIGRRTVCTSPTERPESRRQEADLDDRCCRQCL